MPGLSNNDIASVDGYQLQGLQVVNNSQNLPIKLAVIGEMNTANQSTSLAPVQITSRQQAAALYGYGSPMDIMLRIILANINGPEVWAFPLAAAGGAAANIQTITVTGTATANVTHTFLIGGRSFLEGGQYTVNITSGMTATQTATAIKNAINAVLGCPFSAGSSAGVVTLTARWTGVTSEDLTVTPLTNGNAAGLAYVVAESVAGSGLPSIATALALFGTDWYPIICDGIGILQTGDNAAIDTFNGNANSSTGQYAALNFFPGIYIKGDTTDSTTSSADTVITAALLNEMSIAVGAAPLSLGLPMEAAANYAVAFANISQNNPNIGINGIPLLDMPGITPGGAAPSQSADYTLRNALVKLGCSTIVYSSTKGYIPQDFVTTYTPAGGDRIFSYPRDLMIDYNIRYRFSNIQNIVIGNKQIAEDAANVTATNVVKPKDVVSALTQLAYDLVSQGLIDNAKSMIQSISVVINSTNKNRFDISFNYYRSGMAYVVSTIAKAS